MLEHALHVMLQDLDRLQKCVNEKATATRNHAYIPIAKAAVLNNTPNGSVQEAASNDLIMQIKVHP